jgi:large subunit ribosomal protein L22
MGNRKRSSADLRKSERKNIVSARLVDYPTSPRKMRLLADMIRGVEVDKALVLLQYSTKANALPLHKLLCSAISNWNQKMGGSSTEEVVVREIFVDSGMMLKRMLPAPQGRAYRVRKRYNSVTVILDKRQSN